MGKTRYSEEYGDTFPNNIHCTAHSEAGHDHTSAHHLHEAAVWARAILYLPSPGSRLLGHSSRGSLSTFQGPRYIGLAQVASSSPEVQGLLCLASLKAWYRQESHNEEA